jgi:hypothetical protein
MRAHSVEIREIVLDGLKRRRSLKEISDKVGISIGTIEDWAAGWRKEGTLEVYSRPGMEFTNRAKIASNGYYPCIRKRYAGMRWSDRIEGRVFGFSNQLLSVPFYLDESGRPRPCAYCGALPADGKVWGLDRLDSTLGHIPGNLVPCCSHTKESSKLSCQLSKSKFSLEGWMRSNLSRAYGRVVTDFELQSRLEPVYTLAASLRK